MEILNDFRSQVEQELREILTIEGGGTPSGLAAMYCYHMGFCDQEGNLADLPRGKYVRPILCMMMCAAFRGDPGRVVPAAASLELLHRTSLIFDDIQDDGRERNARPTVWVVWGQSQAINAGLALSCYARLVLQRMKERGVHEGMVLKVTSVLEMAVIDLCWGQFRDISFMGGGGRGLMGYIEMVRGKTGALFGAACEVGALVVPTSQQTADLARQFGMNLGITFQMHDDYLGIWGEETLVGKTPNDLVEKKRSLPVVLALEADREQMEAWLRPPQITVKDAAIIRTWMEGKGIPERVRDLSMQYRIAAQENLDTLPVLPEWRERLKYLVIETTERKR